MTTGHGVLTECVTAKKLPLSAPQTSRAGAGRTTAGQRTGVDLNKQPTGAQSEACNC